MPYSSTDQPVQWRTNDWMRIEADSAGPREQGGNGSDARGGTNGVAEDANDGVVGEFCKAAFGGSACEEDGADESNGGCEPMLARTEFAHKMISSLNTRVGAMERMRHPLATARV